MESFELGQAENARAFSEDIQKTPLSGAVFAPEPVDSCCSEKVLTTEWIVGERLETSSAEDSLMPLYIYYSITK